MLQVDAVAVPQGAGKPVSAEPAGIRQGKARQGKGDGRAACVWLHAARPVVAW